MPIIGFRPRQKCPQGFTPFIPPKFKKFFVNLFDENHMTSCEDQKFSTYPLHA